jgi:hypothetical protein
VDRVEQFEPGAGRKALALYEVDARELKNWLDKASISAASPAARDKPKRRG